MHDASTRENSCGFVARCDERRRQCGHGFHTNDNVHRPVTWVNGNLIELSAGSQGGVAASINASGDIVGSVLQGGVYRAALWSNGVLTQLDNVYSGRNAGAADINNHGQIAGQVENDDYRSRGVVWQNGAVRELSLLAGSDWSSASAINDAGLVVGQSVVGLQRHAVLWNGDDIIDLNDYLDPAFIAAGWYLSEARDINDQGWIVGVATNHTLGSLTVSRAFLMSPVPEPATVVQFLLGLGLLRWMVRQRRSEALQAG